MERLRHSPWPFTENQKFLAKEDLFRQSLAKLSEEFSHFSEKDLVRRVAEEAQGRGINAKDVRELIENKISIEEVLRLGELVTGRKNQERNSFRERSEIPVHDGRNSKAGGPHARLGRADGQKIRRD